MADHTNPFPADALNENRDGRLSDGQVQRFRNMVSGRRRGTRSLALPFGAIGVLLLVLTGPAANAATRHLAGFGFLAAAAAILIAPAFDPLAADSREGRVAHVEGAIGKRRVESRTRAGSVRYYLVVANRQLRTYRSAYDAAPEAGYVRAYFLPRTRHLVNLERLPNAPLPSGPAEVREMFGRMGRALASHDPAAFADARARAAGLVDAVQAIAEKPAAPAAFAAGLDRAALVGRWTNPLATLTLGEDGTASVVMITGMSLDGRWSIDAQGRLLTDVTGRMEPTDAALDGDRLTIQLDGRRLAFTRDAHAVPHS